MQFTDYNWEDECFLIADDDNYSHLLMEKLLVKTGAKCVHAYNGSEAINMLLENKDITIALIDIVMPLYNGFEVVAKTKSFCPEVSYFAYTADVRCMYDNKRLELGFIGCLRKPMLPNKLLKEISKALPVKQAYK